MAKSHHMLEHLFGRGMVLQCFLYRFVRDPDSERKRAVIKELERSKEPLFLERAPRRGVQTSGTIQVASRESKKFGLRARTARVLETGGVYQI